MRTVLASTALAVAVGLSGCGEKAAEVVTEQAAESASGGDVDVDLQQDGANVSVESQDSDVSVSAGRDVTVPDDFPEDVPLYRGMNLQAAVREGQSQSFSISGTTPDAVKTVAEAMTKALEDEGWTEESVTAMETMQNLAYSKSGRSVTVSIVEAGSNTQVSITTGNQ